MKSKNLDKRKGRRTHREGVRDGMACFSPGGGGEKKVAAKTVNDNGKKKRRSSRGEGKSRVRIGAERKEIGVEHARPEIKEKEKKGIQRPAKY